MAEDDEVDVLGDYSFDLLNKNDSFDGTPLVSQNSDLLNCDYTIHPQWLLDKPSTNPALWYDTSDLDVSDYDAQAEPIISTQQNSITDESGWTEKEKDLLNRGIEIFGKSNLNLSQFIGSRTPAEVKYFLKNFYSDVQLSYTSVNEDILFDHVVEETVVTSANVLQEYEIPASIEEVIDAVSTARTTITPRKRTNSTRRAVSQAENNENRRNSMSYDEIPCGQSLLKSNYPHKSKETAIISPKSKQKSPKVKFKTKLRIFPKNSPSKPIKTNQIPSKSALFNRKIELNKAVNKRKYSESDSSHKRAEDSHNSEENVKKDLRIVTGNGPGVPVCEGEEVVKIIKENDTESEEDIDIDIEDDEEQAKLIKTQQKSPTKQLFEAKEEKIEDEKSKMTEPTPKTESDRQPNALKFPGNKILPKRGPQLETLPESVIKELLSMEEPTSEILINRAEISDVEKFLFFEFFENRPTKTPERYLHIRNHILGVWKNTKPNYVRKTTIRNGLKQAGDVNLIGRIHSYLEQVGAINFRCEQTNYYRPLLELAAVTVSQPKEKPVFVKSDSLPRQRLKKKYTNDGEGGYTLTHDEKGEIINTTVVNEEPVAVKQRYLKKPAIRLVYCRPFTEEKPQKYSISLDISTLILMDLHAHMHLSEVMGLIGGYWSPTTSKLLIKRYIPCRNIASSLTHCDMCPISQAKAAETLHGENYDILGWYHSHPTFAPEPSQQDIDTQLSVQQWLGNDIPCIGFILSPFSLHGALIASPYRCMIVDENHLGDEVAPSSGEELQHVPYKFKVDLVVEGLKVGELLERAKQVLRAAYDRKANDASSSVFRGRVDFRKHYFQDNSITYLDKYIYSVKMHLAKCSGINKMTCDAITDGLTKLCRHFSSAHAQNGEN